MVHFLWKVGDWFSKLGGGGGVVSYACQSLLDSQVIRIINDPQKVTNDERWK